MMREHAASLAREEYEYMHEGNGMTNEHIKREAQNLAVWDLQGQHFFGRRFDARRVGNMYEDGTVHYHPVSGGEHIIRLANPYVFRVSDGYHELFIMSSSSSTTTTTAQTTCPTMTWKELLSQTAPQNLRRIPLIESDGVFFDKSKMNQHEC